MDARRYLRGPSPTEVVGRVGNVWCLVSGVWCLVSGVWCLVSGALLRSTSVTDKIPVYFRDKEPPIVSYEYTSTVASKLFNFAPTLSNLNVSEYLSNSQTCQCKKSKFCCEPHGHVITGDLRVIENAKLRELVAKGPKYREPNRVNWKATETMFLESIDLYAKNWSKREQVELKYLSDGKTS